MKVNIMYKDRTFTTIENVRKVTNASTNIPEDWLYVYVIGDRNGNPSIRIPFNRIVCVEVIDTMII